MVFGKIDFLNLLPFYVFAKRYVRSSQFHQSLRYHRGVPSQINRAFAARRVDAAFISSVESYRCRCVPVGIVAHREVLSVLSIPSQEGFRADSDSATSNALARLLGLHGEVIIGDKALRYYYTGGSHEDLARLWYDQTHLPFVFARLCTHHHHDRLQQMSRAFVRRTIAIPHYILQHAAQTRGLSPQQVRFYLKHIHYTLGPKELLGFNRFIKRLKHGTIVPLESNQHKR